MNEPNRRMWKLLAWCGLGVFVLSTGLAWMSYNQAQAKQTQNTKRPNREEVLPGFLLEISRTAGEPYTDWQQAVFQKRKTITVAGRVTAVEFRVLVNHQDRGYVVVGASAGRSVVQEFGIGSHPVLATHAAKIPTPTPMPDPPMLKSIPNVPPIEREDPMQAIGSLVTFHAGRYAATQAGKRVELEPMPQDDRSELLTWMNNALQAMAGTANVQLMSSPMSGTKGANVQKAIFADYRIAIDQGSPVLMAFNHHGYAPVLCVGTGYLILPSGVYVQVQAPGGQTLFVRWEDFQSNMDFVFVKR
jgi:hypothetical protein